jgi:hypothetical protein
MTRLHEREKATARWLPSEGPTKLMYIPPADEKLADQEWKEVSTAVKEIGGPELAELLHCRLTDGNSPSRTSNWGQGLLNVATGGFGTMHRFVKASPLPDGSWSYEVIDLLPETLKDAEIDGSVFEKIGKSISYDERRTYNSVKDFGSISHLPPR